MLRRAALIRTDVSEKCIASIISVTIGELVTAKIVPELAGSFHPDDEGNIFLRNVGSYKCHTT
jgi:hypothetical protein